MCANASKRSLGVERVDASDFVKRVNEVLEYFIEYNVMGTSGFISDADSIPAKVKEGLPKLLLPSRVYSSKLILDMKTLREGRRVRVGDLAFIDIENTVSKVLLEILPWLSVEQVSKIPVLLPETQNIKSICGYISLIPVDLVSAINYVVNGEKVLDIFSKILRDEKYRKIIEVMRIAYHKTQSVPLNRVRVEVKEDEIPNASKMEILWPGKYLKSLIIRRDYQYDDLRDEYLVYDDYIEARLHDSVVGDILVYYTISDIYDKKYFDSFMEVAYLVGREKAVDEIVSALYSTVPLLRRAALLLSVVRRTFS